MFRFLYVIFMNLFRAPYMITRMRYEADHIDKFSRKERYKLVRRVIQLMSKSGKVTTVAYGTQNLPAEGGYIMYPNHQGKYDALGILITHNTPCSLVMDEAKSHTILVSEFLDLGEGLRLKKNDVRQAMRVIMEIAERVKNGERFVLFPEGGYGLNNRNKVGEFKAGSFKSAVKAKAPIVPVALLDSYKVFNSLSWGKITTQVHYLSPLYYEEYKDLNTQEIAAIVKERIEATVEQALTELGRTR